MIPERRFLLLMLVVILAICSSVFVSLVGRA